MTGGGGGHKIYVKSFSINGGYTKGEIKKATPVKYEYKFVKVKKSFAGAQAYCVKNGGNLASVHSKEENAKIHALSR